ncbi:hypothetical protein BLNAU_7945 [Blattamonas nauphoetae]|uniref:Uncharacterized protein n=1 Tax=Blattamonas nauphoetae TaxID=2049346 RepID=A0ABQ9Y070_9EUKA|nr:hypothetical protein BLNAU_7945 [Blattamonas nauphoetae]
MCAISLVVIMIYSIHDPKIVTLSVDFKQELVKVDYKLDCVGAISHCFKNGRNYAFQFHEIKEIRMKYHGLKASVTILHGARERSKIPIAFYQKDVVDLIKATNSAITNMNQADSPDYQTGV